MPRAHDALVADLGFGWRVFSRQRLRTGIAVLTLSLAIGANAAIFSLLNAVILRPFPFPHADRMVLIVDRTPAGGGTGPTIPELLDLRARSSTLDVVTFFDTRDVQVDGGAEPVRVLGARVDPAFLPVLGAQPARGRLINDVDSAAGSPRVLLLSDALWHRNFGADRNVIGRQLVVDGEPRTIAGVLAPGFSLGFLSGELPEVYIPYPLTPDYTLRSAQFANVRRVTAIGRVKEGTSRETAAAELASIGAGIASEHPALYSDFTAGAGFRMDVEPLRDSIGAGSRATLWLLFGAVGLVLLIGCVNAAQFLLSQAVERGPEVSLRNALGASRGRLVTQFLSETLVLAVAAAGLGILQAIWLLGILRSVLPPIRMVGDVALDVPVLGFTVGVAVIATVLCGLLPAFSFSRAGLGVRLISAPRDLSVSGRGRARQLLVAVQVALSVVLLIQAALLMRTLQALERSQSGFNADTVVAMRMRGMRSGSGLSTLYAAYLERLAATPGIAAAAVTSSPVPGRPGTPFTTHGSAETGADRSRQVATYQIISPEYFSVLSIPGLAAGVVGAVFASRLLRANVRDLAALDLSTIALACGAYLAVAIVAMLLPARKALRVDPSAALRGD
jgi:putative ABC transport system permease protein